MDKDIKTLHEELESGSITSEELVKEAIKDSSANTIGIFVGPEGGFEEEEIEKIQEIDGKVVSLGPRILRTETASVVASSIVLYELSDLGGNI